MSQAAFEQQFGVVNADGKANAGKDTTISENVVSVLQAGAFFGALGSAPISGMFDHISVPRFASESWLCSPFQF